MNFLALLFAGVPPKGKGLYARETVEPGDWDFIAINHTRSDRATQAAEVRRRGARLWLYSTPETWQPETWRETLTNILARARELGAVGIIANPESEWGTADAAPLGTALAEAADEFQVVCASYPNWHGLARFAEAAGRKVSGSVEIYGNSSMDPEVFASWYAAWHSAFGGRVCLSIAGWPTNEAMSDAEGFRAYLASLPKSGGAIVWDATGDAPTYITDALATYQPGGSAVGTAALAGSAALRAPGIQALIVLGAIVAAIVAMGAARG